MHINITLTPLLLIYLLHLLPLIWNHMIIVLKYTNNIKIEPK